MEDTKIYLIYSREEDEYTGKKIDIISHGIGNHTLNNYILPPVEPHRLGVRIFHDDNGPYINAK